MRVAARGYQAQIDERAAEYGGSPIYGLAGWAWAVTPLVDSWLYKP